MEEKDRRCPRGKLHCFNWLEDIPGGMTDFDIVEVQFKNTRKQVEETKARLNDELLALNDLRAEAEAEKSRVAGRVNQTSANVSSYSNQIADAEATIDALESMLDEQEQDIAALQKKYEESLQSRVWQRSPSGVISPR